MTLHIFQESALSQFHGFYAKLFSLIRLDKTIPEILEFDYNAVFEASLAGFVASVGSTYDDVFHTLIHKFSTVPLSFLSVGVKHLVSLRVSQSLVIKHITFSFVRLTVDSAGISISKLNAFAVKTFALVRI